MGSTEAKTVADFLVADFEREMQTTLRVLEAVPHGRLDYQPDAKAKTGLGLVRHIVLEDSWLLNGIADGTSDLRDGQIVWATIDSPWLHKVDKDAFGRELERIRAIAPRLILSNHLPPAPGHLMERFLGSLTAAPGAQPFVGPNQAAFEQLLKQMAAPA